MNNTVFINKPPRFLEIMVFLIQKCFSEEWEQICQFSLKGKAMESNSAAKKFP